MRLSIYLLIFIVGNISATNDGLLPIYMRGMKWDKVEEHLKEDLRLSNDVIPTNYVLELDVNIRGHAGVEKSDFNGTVTIHLDIIEAAERIELHSVGLSIEKAQFFESLIMSKPLGVSHISTNIERKTITIYANRTIQPDEKFMLQIVYRGMARMDENGLYENWNPHFNKSFDSSGQFFLASRNFPTGARFWFPCFDEPEKKATFDLRVNHPTAFTAYANARVQRTERISNGRTLSVFEKTRPLPTYHVALSINQLDVHKLSVAGFGEVQLLLSKYSHEIHAAAIISKEKKIDLPESFKRNLKELSSIGEIPKEKIDIIILEGTDTTTVQPGLITIGRYSFEDSDFTESIRNLTQIVTGNLITIRKTSEIWLNDMFSFALVNETEAREYEVVVPLDILHSSLHEKPLRHVATHGTSTKQFLESKTPLPALKASHLLKLLNRFCPESMEALKKYIAQQSGGFASISNLIDNVSVSCQHSGLAREFLEDFIDQPGKALLTVKRSTYTVTIRQTRYHSTYFNSDLRDTKTRYTIPIFYTIDGKSGFKVFHKNETSVVIDVNESSLFLIDDQYDHLYFAFYEDVMTPSRNITEEERAIVFNALRKSMIAALSIGYANFYHIHNQLVHYVNHNIFTNAEHVDFFYILKRIILPTNTNDWSYREVKDASFGRECAAISSWNEMFNNGTQYWTNLESPYSREYLAEHLHCIEEWRNGTNYQKFLEDNFLGENTIIRPINMPQVSRRHCYTFIQWRDLHRFFFRNLANVTHHRFDLLANTVLNQMRVEDRGSYADYPTSNMQEEYIHELRDFVMRNPRRAASMSTQIEMRFEREFIRVELPKWHNVNIYEIEKVVLRLSARRKGGV